MKFFKNKVLIAIFLSLAILCGTFCFAIPNKKVNASSNYSLTIQKVDLKVDGSNNLVEPIKEREIVGDYQPQDILANNVAMLHNSNTTDGYKQYIKVLFEGPADVTLQFLEVNAFLHDTAIETKEVTGVSTENKSYCQYFDLHDIKLLQSGESLSVEDAQGKFTFKFSYMAKTADGTTHPKQTVEASFYALDENSYINTLATSIVEPKVANTQNIARNIVATQSSLTQDEKTFPNLYSYFNYNNANTVDYFGNANALDKIYYPTITYDPTKYYVSFGKILYGETETTTSVFDPETNTVTLTTTSALNTTTQTYDVVEDGDNVYVKIPLYNIGNYTISFDYVAKQYGSNVYEQLDTKTYISANLLDKANLQTIVQENWNTIGDVELSMYGYQLYHTVYKNQSGTTESELSDHATLFADVTNKNIAANKIAGKEFDTTTAPTGFDALATFDTVISTNQAPLMFEYNGSILTEADNITKTYSYYNHYTDSAKTQVVAEKVQIDSNSRFTENGYYEVYVVYTYNNYKYNNSATNTLENGSEYIKVQTFAFVIENVDPQIKATTIDDNQIRQNFDAKGYTNKNVELEWGVLNQFNVLPEVYISTQQFGASTSRDETSAYQSQIANGKILLQDNCLYMITICYGPCVYNAETGKYDYTSSVSYNFTIDKQNITDIFFNNVVEGTIDVEKEVGGATVVETKNVYGVQEQLTDVVTKRGFVLTYGQLEQGQSILRNGKKASGANITVTYDQLLLDDAAVEHISDNGTIYLTNGKTFNGANKDLSYDQITTLKAENEYQFVDDNQTNAVLLENGIYLFHFSDDAGNTTQKIVVVDKTAPVVAKKVEGEYQLLQGKNNIVNEDIEIVWGNKKAIKLDSTFASNNTQIVDSLSTLLANNFVKLGEQYYYYTNISSVVIAKEQASFAQAGTGTTIFAENSQSNLSGEAIYAITVQDQVGNNNGDTYVEMNFDKSLLMAHLDGTTVNNIQNISNNSNFESQQFVLGSNETQRLYPNASTNRQKLYIDWFANESTEYEIKTISCEFYPLTLDTTSANYPYSQNPTEVFDLLKNTTYGTINGMENRIVSSYVNLVQNERYGTKATSEGMYKITRIYKNPLPADSRDTTERTYYFYVDRQNIISYFNNDLLIGSNISINLQNGIKKFKGNDFLQEFIESYVLKTNKLPVRVNIPTDKYYTPSGQDVAIKLNYIIKDSYGIEVFNSTNPNAHENKFVADGMYYVTIFDSNNADINKNKFVAGTNQVNFSFYIENTPPKTYVVETTEQASLIVSKDSFNQNNIKIVWNEDANGYMANIDKGYLQIDRYLPTGARHTLYKMVNGVVQNGTAYGNIVSYASQDDGWDIEVDLSTFNLGQDCKLQITVQYEGNKDDYGNNFSSTQIVYFDYTAPEYNYNQLLSSDQYLSQEQKDGFNNWTSEVNFENYAFVVDENFKIDYAPENGFWKSDGYGHNINDSLSAWYRKYDKYSNDNDAETLQSLVPNDERFDDYVVAPQRLRFNETLKNSSYQNYYTPISNRNIPLYEIVNYEPGYYEIIEQDCAGNYRVYTVAIYPAETFDDALALTYKTRQDGGSLIAEWLTTNNYHYFSNINSNYLSIDNLSFVMQNSTVGNNWLQVVLTKSTQKDATYLTTSPIDISNATSVDSLIDSINNYIAYDINDLTGYSFAIKFVCSNGKTFTINYKTPGKSLELDFAGSIASLAVSFKQDPQNSVYVTQFGVYEAINGVVDYNAPLATDSDGKQIVANPDAPNAQAQTTTYTFRNTSGLGRNLVFAYVDNFGVEYKVCKIIGLADVDYEDMIVIDGDFDKNVVYNNGAFDCYEYITNQIVKINYQSAIYNIESIAEYNEFGMEQFVSVADLSSTVLSNGTTLVNLFDTREPNTYKKYVVKLVDTLNNSYKFVVHYYNKLADVTFMDSSDNYHDMTIHTVIARALYINFQKDQYDFGFGYDTYVQVTKTFTDEYDVEHTEVYMAENGMILDEGATYNIYIFNRFEGTNFSYQFTITKNYTSNFYSVLVKPDGINYQELAPSSVYYNYNSMNIDQYFTIYQEIVEVSHSDNLVCDVIDNIPYGANSYTQIYYIHTDAGSPITYEKYLAVTRVTHTTDLVANELRINETTITNQKLATFTDDSIVISLPAYYQAPGNMLQVKLYHNASYVGQLTNFSTTPDGSKIWFELERSGTYLIAINDLAGNTQWFKDSTLFTLYALNNVVYKLNGQYGINNSVFNDAVTLSFDETLRLFTRQEVSGSLYKQYIAINSTLNGKAYTPTRNGDTYTYNQYGSYVVTLSGIVNNDTTNPIVTTFAFSIINQNEAKVAYEYIGLNGYEVVSIVKNGVEIVDKIRADLNMMTLNSFAISGGLNSVGGNGHYTITVKVANDMILPTQYFSYNVWINNDTDALILCSLPEGESTINTISIQLNLYQIYSKVGECVVKLNGRDFVTINKTTATENQVSTYQLTENTRYNVTLETNSGNTLLSFVVTKVEPLNTIAIIVIVVASLAVVGLTVTFVLLRKKMKIK